MVFRRFDAYASRSNRRLPHFRFLIFSVSLCLCVSVVRAFVFGCYTPKSPMVFASAVICSPSEYLGGSLAL